jgi:hypothetical protein
MSNERPVGGGRGAACRYLAVIQEAWIGGVSTRR